MAWYADVKREIKPITSGYCLALSYNLISSIKSPWPALRGTIDELRNVLLAWNNDVAESSPEKILFLLDHKYTRTNLRASALKGADAEKTTVLRAIVKEHGFSLGLAIIVCHLVDFPDGKYQRRRGNHDSNSDNLDDSEDSFDERPSFGDLQERDMAVETFVDLEGEIISGTLEVDEGKEMIPDNFSKTVERGIHDNQMHEDGLGKYGARTFERWYRRTVLVIWPRCADYIVRGTDGLGAACADLLSTSSEKPTPHEKHLIHFLLTHSATTENRPSAAGALCHAACQWKDVELWKRTIEKYSLLHGIGILQLNSVCNAITQFGFDVVRSSLELMIQREQKNKNLFSFLHSLKAWIDGHNGENGEQLKQRILPWLSIQISEAQKALEKLTEEGIDTLIKLSNSILPKIRLKAASDALTLGAIASQVYMQKSSLGPNIKIQLISDVLGIAITKLVLDGKQASTSYYAGYTNTKDRNSDPNLAIIESYLQTCLDLQCHAAVSAMFKTIGDMAELSRSDTYAHAESLMLPILASAQKYISVNPETLPSIVPGLEEFREVAITTILNMMISRPGSISKNNISAVVQAATLPGGDPQSFTSRVLTDLIPLGKAELPLQLLIDELYSKKADIVLPSTYTGPSIQKIVVSLAKKYAKVSEINSSDAIIKILDRCVFVRAFDAVPVLTERILDAENFKNISSFLRDLIPKLRASAFKHNIDDITTPILRTLLLSFMNKSLGLPPPSPAIRRQKIGRWEADCDCCSCLSVQAFLLSEKSGASTVLEKIGAPERRHVEEFLTQYVTAEGATWSTIPSTPQGLKVYISSPFLRDVKD
ncbi:hypothetical protein PHLCEN_2v242 [Hermanssonia centrifuga]|uniref:Uncharacterized protein n=1 Tax=Hermanssonia centrifuga TaxID=98765 RepID=A0A2R6S6L3_9APHY|nr:hypothetical protein PHLCEN_2v242 [Hermanssonia centrifuga]